MTENHYLSIWFHSKDIEKECVEYSVLFFAFETFLMPATFHDLQPICTFQHFIDNILKWGDKGYFIDFY